MKDARSLAVESLTRTLREGAWSNAELKATLQKADLTPAGRALYKQLYFGALSRLPLLDAALARACRQPLSRLSGKLLALLRVGTWSVYFSDAPQARSVDESVRLCKKIAPGAAGLTNAVLRHLPPLSELSLTPAERLCVSEDVYRAVSSALGEKAEAFLETTFLSPAPVARVNLLRTTPQALIERLQKEGAQAEPAGSAALRLKLRGSVEALPSYREGLFHLQSLPSQAAAEALGVSPGERVIDLCAAPGGKAFTLAQIMENRGELIACELYPHRAALIEKGAARLGLSCVTPLCGDSRTLPLAPAHAILLDAPCSGLGQLARHPELRSKSLADLPALLELQEELLHRAADLLLPGGRLVYSTCTLNPAENGDQAARLAALHPELKLLDEQTIAEGGEGFYLTRWEKQA